MQLCQMMRRLMLSQPTCTSVCSQGLPGAGATTSRPSHLPPSQLCAVREPMRSFPPFSHTLLTKRPRLWYAHRTAAAFTEPGSEASLVPELHVEASVPTSHTALHLPGFQPIRITMDLSPPAFHWQAGRLDAFVCKACWSNVQ